MDTESLKSQLDSLVKDPALQASNGMTYCNIGVYRISQLFGVTDFKLQPNGDPPMANTMCAVLGSSLNFKQVDSVMANTMANCGRFVIACHQYDGHGHVATVYPSPEMFFSPSLKKEVPFVANVGKKNGVYPVSECFPVAEGEPSYYSYSVKDA